MAADPLSGALKEYTIPFMGGKKVLQQLVQWRKSTSSRLLLLAL